ncbi:MAG: glucuronyl hydrolase [Bacteroidales bacterium]|nr:glucuronyl hydrolase [Bacteroidales bacterium]
MKKIKYLPVCFIMVFMFFSCTKKEKSFQDIVNDQLEFASAQYLKLFDKTKDSLTLPRTTDKNGNLIMAPSDWWTSGFIPGTFWYLYENSMDTTFRSAAQNYTRRVEKEQYNTGTHDLGFMLFCSFGNGYRLTADTSYKRIMITGARSLCTRFRPPVGCIQSWGSGNGWQCPVIIDNMMNLEFLLWATKATGDSSYYKIAVTHADTTIRNHFRSDYSSYHVVDYDTITGKVLARQTHQGAADESAWSRGQAWALYGYTMMYRETKIPKYLDMAVNIADFILEHPNLPSDKIPYWDFNAPAIPNEPRDASAAAIICSALIDLSQFVDVQQSENYLKVARQQITTLSSPLYCAEPGGNGGFILKHSVGSKPANSEIDVPLTYADYYYVESLMKMKELLSRNTKN